jgi:signal transduction histidine kinase
LFPPAIADQTFFALGRALATGQLHAFEYGMPPGEEVQFFEARVMSITSESAIIMVRDISQRKFVQTEREKLINELEGKNSELERFTYTVSHDLKSPLITIKGFLGFLEQDALSGNAVRLKADIQRIASATDKMQSLLSELLDLSRVGRLANPYENINFEELVREAVELVYGRIHSAGIYVSIQENLPSVHGDRQRLVEVIQNLIDNAAKFMGDQAHPRIEIGLHGYEDKKPVFYVMDNGIGIESIHHDRIFGLFNKLDASSEGTGIGLALVKRIIEVHGGRIWIKSEMGKGTTFFFTLQPEPAA